MRTLIESISGIRGIYGAGLDTDVLIRYALAFGSRCQQKSGNLPRRVIVGRDARISGEECTQVVTETLRSLGLEVVDAGLAPTPTVGMAVRFERARGGIMISASHNPEQWNALKLLNEKGEFLSPDEGARVMASARRLEPPRSLDDSCGAYKAKDFLEDHIAAILSLDFCNPEAVAAHEFSVLVDGINSVGAVALPRLLEALGVSNVHLINGEMTGRFAHPAEPLPQHLGGTMTAVKAVGADIGLVVDPDADRLALIDEKGEYVSEELTQVIAADFLWQTRAGSFVTNLSSSRAIDDVADRYGMQVFRSAVGEINVVKAMQAHEAILGGEGNGGVILPDLHYGRDALVGAAMVLQQLARRQEPLSIYRRSLPSYVISKNRLEIDRADEVLARFAIRHAAADISTLDGVKLDFEHGWVHVRKSNTEPIVRIYAEASTEGEVKELVRWCQDDLRRI